MSSVSGAGIVIERLSKSFQVPEKAPGFRGAMQSFFKRRTRLVTAVDNISFKIDPGEAVGFLGPNGAGKTTTMKMLAGLMYPSSGLVSVAGHEPQKRDKRFLRSITLVMGQKQQLLWDLPPVDSFLVNQAAYGISDSDYRETLGELSEMLDLGDLLKRPVRKLSLGERMKCEIAASLLHRPKILFLDEPTIGLDVNMQQALRKFILNYNERHGATILLTSHYMADVTALTKRVIVISDGRLVFDGNLSALVEDIAPIKVLKLRFHDPQTEADLSQFGGVTVTGELTAEIRVPRREAPKVVSQLLSALPFDDISIEDVPIEEIVSKLFTADKVAR